MHSEFKTATQIYVNPIHFEIQLILRNELFLSWWPKLMKKEKLPEILSWGNKFKSATQIYVNPIFWITPRTWWPKLMKSEKLPKFFHRVIFTFWIQICNPNSCISHIFWITANNEKLSFFAYPDLMTKIDEIKKIARNSFIG